MENKQEFTQKGKKHFWLWFSLFMVFVIVIAACIGVWVYHLVLRSMMNQLYSDARIEIIQTPGIGIGDKGSSSPASPLPGGSEEDAWLYTPMVKIDFPLLQNTSKNVYSWIEIPGTEVAFPIVQHPTNNSYYLRRAINGAYDVTGCTYTQNYNSKDFTDPNTVIYGHYMDDGSKFGPLLSYMDKDYFESHRKIVIYTETEQLVYKVFAALPFDTRHVIRSYRVYENPLAEFLEDVYASRDARAVFADDVTVDPETDKIITLSTCLKTGSKRYLVLAVLMRSQLCE